ncbi:hypothetical protein [Streptomyces sp. B93]|uniref:hypothetical protein n=1 Tax=Streptomyces sp. B93 TaxID=2824875 RepID=UPI001B3874AE|nr:hypothetical protein [Streptomyces sp. B93]MBQ1093409.1 hypothetical protein [Streptomyces sp. B93]
MPRTGPNISSAKTGTSRSGSEKFLGHRRALEWVAGELAGVEPDGRISFAALQMLQDAAFAYIDRVSEQVVAEYETERERWLANRSTIRTVTLSMLLAGDELDTAAAEQILGYRLRQEHLGLVLWADERMTSPGPLECLGQLTSSIAQEVGSESSPLFVPQDRSLGWGWIPLRAGTRVDLDRLARVLGEAGSEVKAAIGAVGTGLAGFRATHRQALRAHQVAVIGAERAHQVTSFTAPGVRRRTTKVSRGCGRLSPSSFNRTRALSRPPRRSTCTPAGAGGQAVETPLAGEGRG